MALVSGGKAKLFFAKEPLNKEVRGGGKREIAKGE